MARPAQRLRALFLLLIGLLILGPQPATSQIERFVVVVSEYTPSGEYAGDYDLYGSLIAADGYVKWGQQSPKPLSALSVREFDPSGAPDGEGGFYVAYVIEHTDEANQGDRDIVARRFSEDGVDKWGDTATGPFRLVAKSSHNEGNPHCVKSANGVVIVYEVEYTSGEFKGDVDIAALSLDEEGNAHWTSGTWIANSNERERIAGAYPDGDGNVVIVYERSGMNGSGTGSDIMATRLKPDGSIGWEGNDGRRGVVAGSAHSEQNAVLTPDGEGGAFIAYELEYRRGPRTGDVDIIAQHIDREGDRRWLDAAAPPIVSSSERAREVSPAIDADSLGVTVAFEMHFGHDAVQSDSSVVNSVIAVQRLSRSGKAEWNNGAKAEVVLVKNRVTRNPSVVADGNGAAFLVMEGKDTVTDDVDVFVQKMDSSGTRMWGEEGYAIEAFGGPMPENIVDAVDDGYGGLVLFGLERSTYRIQENSQTSDSTIVAQRLNREGVRSWGDGERNIRIARCQLGSHVPRVIQVR